MDMDTQSLRSFFFFFFSFLSLFFLREHCRHRMLVIRVRLFCCHWRYNTRWLYMLRRTHREQMYHSFILCEKQQFVFEVLDLIVVVHIYYMGGSQRILDGCLVMPNYV